MGQLYHGTAGPIGPVHQAECTLPPVVSALSKLGTGLAATFCAKFSRFSWTISFLHILCVLVTSIFCILEFSCNFDIVGIEAKPERILFPGRLSVYLCDDSLCICVWRLVKVSTVSDDLCTGVVNHIPVQCKLVILAPGLHQAVTEEGQEGWQGYQQTSWAWCWWGKVLLGREPSLAESGDQGW